MRGNGSEPQRRIRTMETGGGDGPLGGPRSSCWDRQSSLAGRILQLGQPALRHLPGTQSLSAFWSSVECGPCVDPTSIQVRSWRRVSSKTRGGGPVVSKAFLPRRKKTNARGSGSLHRQSTPLLPASLEAEVGRRALPSCHLHATAPRPARCPCQESSTRPATTHPSVRRHPGREGTLGGVDGPPRPKHALLPFERPETSRCKCSRAALSSFHPHLYQRVGWTPLKTVSATLGRPPGRVLGSLA
mmetsp:Transcript_22431/g.65209  ORF Transcript_22431/g.65209 Transcript_22431/m.65209 type:complete len:244 (-) Transcript_22431:210-941(-)